MRVALNTLLLEKALVLAGAGDTALLGPRISCISPSLQCLSEIRSRSAIAMHGWAKPSEEARTTDTNKSGTRSNSEEPVMKYRF